MEDPFNASSEEKLAQLRQEGKITEAEYHDLLAAMQTSAGAPTGAGRPVESEFQAFRKRVLTASLVVCVLGLPIGLALGLPYVWLLSIAGIVVSALKLKRMETSWLAKALAQSKGSREGKNAETWYHDLFDALIGPPVHHRDSANRPNIPPVLWVALVCLTLMFVGKIVAALTYGPAVLVDAALSAVLLWGLYHGHKWAYVLTYVFVAIGVAYTGQKGLEATLLVLLLDSLVLVPVILSRGYFFHKPAHA